MKSFLDEFSSLLEHLTLARDHLLIAGDFNIHVDNVASIEAANFLELLDSHNLTQHIHCPTHVKGHTLDLLLTRQDDNNVHSIDVLHDMPSDHSALISAMRFEKPRPVKKQVQSRNPRKLDSKLFVIRNQTPVDCR